MTDELDPKLIEQVFEQDEVNFTNEQDDFLNRYVEKKFATWTQQFWARKAEEQHLIINEQTLLTKLTDASEAVRTAAKQWFAKHKQGDQVCIDQSKVRVVCSWSHCLCGQRIKYQYFVDDYGPIGSTCISVFTGMNGKLVSDYSKNFRLINTVRSEAASILKTKTFEDWAKEYRLDDKLKFIDNLRDEHDKESVKGFVGVKLPLPMRLGYRLSAAARSGMYVAQANEQQQSEEIRILLESVDKVAHQPLIVNAFKQSAVFETMCDIRNKAGKWKLSDKQISYLSILVSKLQDIRQIKALIGLQALSYCRLGQVHGGNVMEMLNTARNRGLSEGQLDYVLAERTLSGKVGLIHRFRKQMNNWIQTVLTQPCPKATDTTRWADSGFSKVIRDWVVIKDLNTLDQYEEGAA